MRIAFAAAGRRHSCRRSLPVAPTGEPTESNRGDNVSNYNVLQSFELGYRWNTDGGDTDMYRSTVNYTDGIRLLSSSLSVQSRDGHGACSTRSCSTPRAWATIPTNPPFCASRRTAGTATTSRGAPTPITIPALTISYGEHLMDTVRRLQDHDLTLFPQSAIRFFLGYSRDTQSGPALSTIQLFDSRGDEFPLFTNMQPPAE